MSYLCSSRPDSKQIQQAADLIDAGGQLAKKLDRNRFEQACIIVVALDPALRVIGVAAVKERRGDVAEIGYLIVHPDFRRRGIAQELTRRRIEAARELGLRLLYTNVRRDNDESIGNLHKAEFLFWGDFVSAHDTGHVISWFFYPLTTKVDGPAQMERLTRRLKRSPAKES
jgi:RimJ/RimL family protein N-acetyltransferase